jgi:hypothetical protein
MIYRIFEKHFVILNFKYFDRSVSLLFANLSKIILVRIFKNYQFMHKKIESELVSLAHSVLQMKNKEDVLALKEKAHELYEKLSVLAFVDRYVEVTPSASKDEILEKVTALDSQLQKEPKIPKLKKDSIEQIHTLECKISVAEELVAELVEPETSKLKNSVPVSSHDSKNQEDLFKPTSREFEAETGNVIATDLFSGEKDSKGVELKKNTLEKELEGTVSLDLTTELFENATRVGEPKKSLNDVFVRSSLQIGLNDRIAFVKHLFDGNQGDFNRVISQLNSFKTEKEAIRFVSKMVKSDYNWKGKEEYEERFISLITRKFA